MLTVSGKLRFVRDYFFLILVAQVLAYLHFGPSVAAWEVDSGLRLQYATLQLWAIVLFEVPLYLVYLNLRARLTRGRSVGSSTLARPSGGKSVTLVVGASVGALAFLVIALRYDLLFRRIGDTLAPAQLAIPMGQFVLYRLFIEGAPVMFGSMLVCYFAARHTGSRRIQLVCLGGLFVVGLVYGWFLLLNTRLGTVRFVAIAFGLTLYWRSAARTVARIPLAQVAALVLVVVYCVKVIETVRHKYVPGEPALRLAYFNPLYSYGESLETKTSTHLNGIDFMAQMTPAAKADGFARGQAWVVPVFLTFGQFFARDVANQYKLSLMTNAKSYLMVRYTPIVSSDPFNCLLTDAYGNFGLVGFAMVAIALGMLYALASAALATPRSAGGLVVGLFALTHGFYFEQEFILLLIGWVKVIPVLGALLLVNPLRVRDLRASVPVASSSRVV
jgi:hypothetical protein